MSEQATSGPDPKERTAHFALSGDDVLSLIIEEDETEEEES